MAVKFDTEWVEADAVVGSELSATWASLLVRVGDSVITRVVDQRAGSVRDRIFVPLYPLAEWLVTNWWFLLREVENPIKIRDDDSAFRRRHSLGASREGYAFPNLEVVPSGVRTRLAWTSEVLPLARLEFLNQGQAWVDRDEFRECCSDFVDRVIRRLVSCGVSGTFLQEEWTSIQAADEDESMFCRTAAGLGWDPYALDDSEQALVFRVEQMLKGAVFEEAVAVLDAQNLEANLSAIVATLNGKTTSISLDRFRAIRHNVLHRANMQSDGVPWDAGYALARHVREQLDLDGDPLPSMADLGTALGEEPDTLKEVTRPFGYIALVDGVVKSDENGLPAFALRSGSDNSRRFHFCRSLAEVLVSPGSDALLTQAHSDRQQRSRAFAAEFLVPSAALQARVSCSIVDEDCIDELATEFGVSSLVVAHQLQNHKIAKIGSTSSMTGMATV